jgi:hypothetical protein
MSHYVHFKRNVFLKYDRYLLTCTTLVPNGTYHVILMSSFSTINQQQRNYVSDATARWTRMHVVMVWNPGQANCLHAAAIFLLYITQKFTAICEFFVNVLPYILL